LEFGVRFYEAGIKADAILWYVWFSQGKSGTFPHHKALILDCPGRNVLYVVNDHPKNASPFARQSANVHSLNGEEHVRKI